MQAYIPLKAILDMKTSFEDADFWLIRKGSEGALGRPVKEYLPSHIGVRLNDVGRQILDPNYLYYLFVFIHGQGVWTQLALGTTNLKHITLSSAKNFAIPIEVPDDFHG